MTRKNFIKAVEAKANVRVTDYYQDTRIYHDGKERTSHYAVVIDYDVDEEVSGKECYYRVAYLFEGSIKELDFTAEMNYKDVHDRVCEFMFNK